MEHEIQWGILVALYLFLAGAGAGALFVSGYYVLDKKIEDKRYFDLAKYSAIAGTALLVVGVGMIVLDLTTFQYGLKNIDFDKLLRFYKLFMVFAPSSIMSWGTWLLFFSIPIALIYVLSFTSIFNLENKRVFLARLNMSLAIGICTYTAFLLGDIMHNIVWNNSALVILFMVSALSSGVAVVLLLRMFIFKANIKESEVFTFSKVDASILSFEILCVAIFAYTLSVVSKSQDVPYVLDVASSVGQLWWLGAVGVGLIIPFCINVYAVTFKGTLKHYHEYLMIACLLGGAFCLRYSVLLAGQVY